jgi:hypothetical protein
MSIEYAARALNLLSNDIEESNNIIRKSLRNYKPWTRDRVAPAEWNEQRAKFPDTITEGRRNGDAIFGLLAKIHDTLANEPATNPLWGDLKALWEIAQVMTEENQELRGRASKLYDAFVDQAFRQWHLATCKATYRY